MKILTIYFLEENNFGDEFLDKIRLKFNLDIVISIQACNQLDNIQYPYFVFENI